MLTLFHLIMFSIKYYLFTDVLLFYSGVSIHAFCRLQRLLTLAEQRNNDLPYNQAISIRVFVIICRYCNVILRSAKVHCRVISVNVWSF